MSEENAAQSEPAVVGNDREVWAVFCAEGSPRHIAGFIVTDKSRIPSLVAWVEGSDQVAMLSAKLISDGRRSPEANADLRGRAVPEWLYGRMPRMVYKPQQLSSPDC
jgi:hypothetical protein